MYTNLQVAGDLPYEDISSVLKWKTASSCDMLRTLRVFPWTVHKFSSDVIDYLPYEDISSVWNINHHITNSANPKGVMWT